MSGAGCAWEGSIDVAKEAELATKAANISDLQNGRSTQLALYVEVEIMHVRSAEILADTKHTKRRIDDLCINLYFALYKFNPKGG